jgi:hypothetical protein
MDPRRQQKQGHEGTDPDDDRCGGRMERPVLIQQHWRRLRPDLIGIDPDRHLPGVIFISRPKHLPAAVSIP